MPNPRYTNYSAFGCTPNIFLGIAPGEFALGYRAITAPLGHKVRVRHIAADVFFSGQGDYINPAALVDYRPHIFVLRAPPQTGYQQPEPPPGFTGLNWASYFNEDVLGIFQLAFSMRPSLTFPEPKQWSVDLSASNGESLLVCCGPIIKLPNGGPADIIETTLRLSVDGSDEEIPPNRAAMSALPRFDVAGDNHFAIPVR